MLKKVTNLVQFDVSTYSSFCATSDNLFSVNPYSNTDTQMTDLSQGDETRTVYSELSTMHDQVKDAYMNELIHQLLKAVSPLSMKPPLSETISSSLPGLLQAFALRLASADSSVQIHRDMMVFIHKYRK